MTNNPPILNYIVAGSKPWNRDIFESKIQSYPGNWTLISNRDELNLETIQSINPVYIFFLHWSWIVPAEIVNQYDCVCFHMTDVPFGKGGSPLQNLIVRGFTETKLTALKMIESVDAGPVYVKRPLSLFGNAEEIYIRASEQSAEIILEIINTNLKPVPQEGEDLLFTRRKPEQSELPQDSTLEEVFNHIRMLDADGYPAAFLDVGNIRMEFKKANRYHKKITAEVTITEKDSKE